MTYKWLSSALNNNANALAARFISDKDITNQQILARIFQYTGTNILAGNIINYIDSLPVLRRNRLVELFALQFNDLILNFAKKYIIFSPIYMGIQKNCCYTCSQELEKLKIKFLDTHGNKFKTYPAFGETRHTVAEEPKEYSACHWLPSPRRNLNI